MGIFFSATEKIQKGHTHLILPVRDTNAKELLYFVVIFV
jgi:hypothetical protein